MFLRNPIVPRSSRTSCNRSVNIVVPIILENDAILQPGWVIRYIPRGDAFALLCRVSSGQTLFRRNRNLFSSVSFEDTHTRLLASDAGIRSTRECACSVHTRCDRDSRFAPDDTSWERASSSNTFLNDVSTHILHFAFEYSNMCKILCSVKERTIVNLNNNVCFVLCFIAENLQLFFNRKFLSNMYKNYF